MRSLGISRRDSNLTAPLFCPAMGAASGIPYTEKGPTAAGYPISKRLLRHGMRAGEEAVPATTSVVVAEALPAAAVVEALPAAEVVPAAVVTQSSGPSVLAAAQSPDKPGHMGLYIGLALAGAAYYYFKVKKGY
jgi:hypothetical protein